MYSRGMISVACPLDTRLVDIGDMGEGEYLAVGERADDGAEHVMGVGVGVLTTTVFHALGRYDMSWSDRVWWNPGGGIIAILTQDIRFVTDRMRRGVYKAESSVRSTNRIYKLWWSGCWVRT